jgi:trehalose 6-phosphate synthase
VRQERGQWDAAALKAWVAATFRGRSLIVLANRQPVRHDLAPDGRIVTTRSSGGLVTALEPLIQACSGAWVAHGAGTADALVVDSSDGVDVPPGRPLYRLRRVWLDRREERGYYYGFANECLWPLCHRAHVQPVFRSDDFRLYSEVNERFAEAVCREARDASPVVLVQDYHFALAPRFIRARLPNATIVAFWHIPFPSARDLAICPWSRQLIDGLLGSTLVGFQTPEDRSNFSDAAAVLGAQVSPDHIKYSGRCTHIGDYPVSVEWPNPWAGSGAPVSACRLAVRRRLGLRDDVRLGVGVDRLDYTKGIAEKFLAVERLLERHEEFRGRFVFVQVAEPSRQSLPAYQEARARIAATAARVNARFGSGEYVPIVLLQERHEPEQVHELLRAADVCYVGSLHDGMNLVAKEFVTARDDLRGVLVLSEFAGAARELTAALIVNPYATDHCAAALRDALVMPEAQQETRMRMLQAVVRRSNTYAWAAALLGDAARTGEAGVDLRRRPSQTSALPKWSLPAGRGDRWRTSA